MPTLIGALCLTALVSATALAPARDLFLPTADETWETASPEALGWDRAALDEACDFVRDTHGKSFLILKDGRIVVERHWTAAGPAHAQYVMSTGKSITAFLVGVARAEGKLTLGQPVSEIIGPGWSRATPTQEREIRVEHLLTMTSGLDARLAYEAPPGAVWRYNTPAYQQLHPLLEKAVGTSVDAFSARVLFEPLGMKHSRFRSHSFVMTAREMARFGLLILARGTWNDRSVIEDRAYFAAMLAPSQRLNRAYGYLWWLNGQESFRTVGPPRAAVRGALVPDAPADMVSANGKGGQRISVAPGAGLVVVRLGENPAAGHGGDTEGNGTQSRFDVQLWRRLARAIPAATVRGADGPPVGSDRSEDQP
ncbi:MAG: serine hydrolase domain-containing protein [Planctomycetota bacterium]|nr:serine hydrolase [Planctomycetota bacterium]